MALTADQQALFDHVRESLPRWMWTGPGKSEAVRALVLAMDSVRVQIDAWRDSAYITQAAGFWLDGHAVDRGTARQGGESDASLQQRLRTVPDAATKPAITSAVNAQLTADGVAGTCAIVEMRKDKAFLNDTAYLSRGYRMGDRRHQIVVILPYGTGASTESAVEELLEQRAAAGVVRTVEVRGVP